MCDRTIGTSDAHSSGPVSADWLFLWFKSFKFSHCSSFGELPFKTKAIDFDWLQSLSLLDLRLCLFRMVIIKMIKVTASKLFSYSNFKLQFPPIKDGT